MDIISCFRAVVRRCPDQTALIYDGGSFTFRELDRQSERIASWLSARQLRGRQVGVAMGRSPRWVSVLFGIWKSGAVYVPLDLGNPRQRIDLMVSDCEAALVIKDAGFDYDSQSVPVYDAADMDSEPAVIGEETVSGDDLAYIIYTSGTSGMPKGVPVTHRRAALLARLARDHVFYISSGSRMLQLAGLNFSASLVEVLCSVLSGACLVQASDAERHDPARLAALLERERVQSAVIPPALLSVMPSVPLPSLATLVVSGEGVTPEVMKRWMSGRRMVNAYGFTENTVLVTNGVFGENTPANDIGIPVPGTVIHVLDENLKPVPDGEPGELCVSGRQLAAGYWKAPQLTAEKFIANPFATERERRKGHAVLYRSGDRVVRCPDGHYLYLGRMDHQIKIRGMRVECGEIEQCLNRYPGVAASIVLLRPHEGRQMLVAYLQSDGPINREALDTFVASRLPDYMCPSVYVVLSEFPLTLNRKIDRSRLPEPEWPGTDTDVRPVTPTEKEVARIWCSLLGLRQVGRYDSFISLGGDSLSVLQMADALEQSFGVRFDAGKLYRYQKLSAISAYVDSLLQEYPVPPSLACLLADCLTSDTANDAYKLAVIIPWDATLDVSRLQQAWLRVLREQDIFRSSFFRADDGVWRLRTVPADEDQLSPLPVVSVSDQAGFLQEARRLYRMPLGPEHPELYRACLYRFPDGTFRLLLVIHHLITDGWSLRLLYNRLRASCLRPDADPLAIGASGRYGRYASWCRRAFSESAIEEKTRFWASYLSGCPELSFSAPVLRSDVSSFAQGRALTLPMSVASRDALRRFCGERSITPLVVCLSVYRMLLDRYSGQDDFAIGVAFTDRNKAGFHSLMGYLVALLPVRLRLSSDTDNLLLLTRRLTDEILLLSDNSLPLDRIGHSLQQGRAHDGISRLVRFAFGLEDTAGMLSIPDEWTIASNFSLSLIIRHGDDGWSYHYQYASDCFDEAYLRAFTTSFDTALCYLTEYPVRALSSCPLVSDAQISRVVSRYRFSGLAVSYGIGYWRSVTARFDEQVSAFPDRDAFVYDGVRTSYRRLQSLAAAVSSSVSRVLRTEGISTPVPIGILLADRSLQLPALLGVLKSGNSYVPLDSGLPPERLSFMIADAGIRLVLSDAAESLPGCAFLRLDDALRGDDATDRFQPHPVCPDDTAYIIYTSGTSGRPKATPVRHASLSLFADNQSRIFRLCSGSRVLQYAQISFDASVLEIFPALQSGATLVIPTPEERMDADLLLALLRREQVSCALLPPALLTVLPHRSLPHLKVLAVGGESTPLDVMRRWSRGRILVNEYGPTENTVVTTCSEFFAGMPANDIGCPLAGVSCYVLDAAMHLMPDGVPGELYIGGLQLTAGYLGRQEQNHDRFVANPFVEPSDRERGLNTRLYRSGDLAVRMPDGHFHYLGRKDTQVKLRGFRIELDEISRSLERHSGVRQALAVLHQDEAAAPRIAAYVVPEPDCGIQPAMLDAFLRTCLPPYMIPAAWCVLESFPMTSNGKIDRQSLPQAAPFRTTVPEPPVGPDELLLARVACRLLQVAEVGVLSDLFDCGLTSLQVVEFVYEARRGGLQFSASDVYRHRTIRKLLASRPARYFFWDGNSSDGAKPLMVLIGYPGFVPFYDRFVSRFRDHFDFFVFESFLDTHSGCSDCRAGELVEYYYNVLLRQLTGRTVFAVAGYCLGGELALILAERLRQEAYPGVRALVIESYLFRDKHLLMPVPADDPRLADQALTVNALIRSMPLPEFSGPLVVCLATCSSDAALMQKNRTDWLRVYPDAVCCLVHTDHWNVFDESSLETLYQTVLGAWGSDFHQHK